MTWQGIVLVAVAGTLLAGCVSHDKYVKAVIEQKAARRAAAEAAAALDTAQKEARIKLAALEQEKARLASELTAAQEASAKAVQELTQVKSALEAQQPLRQEIQGKLDKLRSETDEAKRVGMELRRERDLFRTKADDLQRQLDTAQQELGSATAALADARTRIAALEKEKEQVVATLTQAKNRARDLETRLAAEQVKVSTLREENQRLMSGATTAQEEIAKLQKRAGELETKAAHVADLRKRLEERDQEIAKLRQTVADRQTLLNKVAALTNDLDKTKERIITLTGDLKVLSEDTAQVKRERDNLLAEMKTLRISLHKQEELLRSWEKEKAHVEAKRAAKEAEESMQLAQISAALANALEAEIAKGDVRVQQTHGRLAITLTDQALFEPSQGEVKPAGITMLKQISEALKDAHGWGIVVEGHTDNVPAGTKPLDKHPTNWELSMARAASVVHYLSEQGGLDSSRLSVGYADTHSASGNDTGESRVANRRIEIVLYPRNPAKNVDASTH